jgi:microcystin-dependent protein
MLGALNRLTTTNRNNLVASLNSFYGLNVPAGSIFPYVGKTPPEGYLFCDGEEYELSKYPELYTAIGFNFGIGTTSTKFRVPDLKERIVVGFDENDEDFNTVGKLGGSATVVLKPENLPRHAHTISSGTHSHSVYAYGANANVTYSDDGSNRDGKNSGYSTSTTSVSNDPSTWSHSHTFTSGWQYHYHDILKAGNANPAAHENRQPFRYTNFIIKY